MESPYLESGLMVQGQNYDSADDERADEYAGLSCKSTKEKDSHVRSLVKGITYRVISTIATVTITFLVLGDVSVAFEIGFVDFFVKLLIYYLHERAWSLMTSL